MAAATPERDVDDQRDLVTAGCFKDHPVEEGRRTRSRDS